MSLPVDGPDTQTDWEVTSEGLYIATRQFLVRRGYCCSNRCRNCPYINWREDPAWQPAPAAAVRRMRVSPRTLNAVRAHVAWHEQASVQAQESEQERRAALLAHYRLLLERWY